MEHNNGLTAGPDFNIDSAGISMGDQTNLEHDDVDNTYSIIQNLKGKTSFFGYIHIGRQGKTWTTELSAAEIKSYIDGWAKLGAEGIFFDEAGNDYGVDDSLRSDIASYAHSKGLKIIWNAWDPADLQNGDYWKDGDGWCAESWFVHGDSNKADSNTDDPPILTNGKDELNKYNTVKNIESSRGVDIYIYQLTTEDAGYTKYDSAESKARQKYAWYMGRIMGTDYFCYTDLWYSASNNYVYIFPIPNDNLGSYYTSDPTYSSISGGYRWERQTSLGVIWAEGPSSDTTDSSSVLKDGGYDQTQDEESPPPDGSDSGGSTGSGSGSSSSDSSGTSSGGSASSGTSHSSSSEVSGTDAYTLSSYIATPDSPLEVSFKVSGPVKVGFISVSGKLVFREDLNVSAGQTFRWFGVDSNGDYLLPGLYLMKMVLPDGTVTYERVLVKR